MNELKDLRKEIDAIDNHLLDLIQKRLIVMKQTGDAKKRLGKSLKDEKREKEKISLLEKRSKELGIPVRIVLKIWQIFFRNSEEIEK